MLLSCAVLCTAGFAYSTDGTGEELVRFLADRYGFSVAFDGGEVTRGEFLQTAICLVTGGNMGAENCNFGDIEKDTQLSYCAAYAQKNGIISKADNFNPDAAISGTDAVKITASALNYNIYAEMHGGYPGGYIYAGKQADLTNKVKNTGTAALSEADAYRLIYNMLNTAPYSLESISGKSSDYKTGSKSILESVYDITVTEGILRADKYTSITDSAGKMSGNIIRVGTEDMRYTGAAKLLGYNVKAYAEDQDGINECVFIEPVKNNTAEFAGREYEGISGGSMQIRRGSRQEKYEIHKSAKYILNHKAITLTEAKSLPQGYEYKITLVDNDNDNMYDCVLINQYVYTLVQAYDAAAGIIMDQNGKGGSILLPEEAEDCVISGTYDETDITSPEQISAGMLLASLCSPEGDYAEIYVCDNSKTFTPAATAPEDSKIYDTFDTEYSYGAYFAENYIGKLNLGKEGVFTLGVNGELVTAELAENEASVGWIVPEATELSSMGSKLLIKVFTQKGEMVVFTADKRTTVDGEKITGGAKEISEMIENLGDYNRMIGYRTDEDGTLKNIDFPETYSGSLDGFPNYDDEDNRLTLFYEKWAEADKMSYRSTVESFNDAFSINGAKVFMIPKKENKNDEDKYSVTSAGALVGDAKYGIMAYNLSESLAAEILVVFDADSGNATNSEGVVVQNVRSAINKYGEDVYELSICDNGIYKYLYSTEATNAAASKLKKGDIIRIRADGDKLAAVEKDYSYGDTPSTSSGARVEYLAGKAYDTANGYVSIMTGATESYSNLKNAKLLSNISYIHIKLKDAPDGGKTVTEAVVKPAMQQSIMCSKSVGAENASLVVVQKKYYETKRVFVYVIERN